MSENRSRSLWWPTSSWEEPVRLCSLQEAPRERTVTPVVPVETSQVGLVKKLMKAVVWLARWALYVYLGPEVRPLNYRVDLVNLFLAVTSKNSKF